MAMGKTTNITPFQMYDSRLTLASTYLIFGSFSFLMFFFVWFFIPETKGRSLEHMDELFGETRATTKGEDAPSISNEEVAV